MPVSRAFRVSTYLTLLLACACLGYAELPFLPFMPYFLGGVGAFLLGAFLLEGRWAMSAWMANALGVVVAGVAAVWVSVLARAHAAGTDFSTGAIPWPAALLPHMGPLLMLLLLVKLYRPKKMNDYWLLQTIGFLQVALACVLSGEALFGLLLLGYLVAGLWCLSLLQLHGAAEAAGAGRPPAARAAVPWRLLGLARAGRWALAVALLGGLTFLLIPRPGNTYWDTNRLTAAAVQRLTTGYSEEVDLNRVGTVTSNDEPAFEVRATDARGRPVENLGEGRRWRGITLERYYRGHWTSAGPVLDLMAALHGRTRPPGTLRMNRGPMPRMALLPIDGRVLKKNQDLPRLGDGEVILTFRVERRRAGGLFLAEPVVLEPGTNVHPYRALTIPAGVPPGALFYESWGGLAPVPWNASGVYVYAQATAPRPPGREDLTPLGSAERLPDEVTGPAPLLPPFRKEARRLLRRVVAAHQAGLLAEHLEPDRDGVSIRPEHQERVARALCHYLATSGDYGYSEKLTRFDRGLDPTLDFLVNVKTGHCQRFATGLALMLRALGIPTRLVKGFRGADHEGGGRYIVRQSHAHSWVDALVPAAALGGRRCWLTLDPTPDHDRAGMAGLTWAEVWDKLGREGALLWRSLVVEFNPDQQREALLGLWGLVSPARWLPGLGAWVSDSLSGRFWTKAGFWILALPAGFLLYRLARRRRRGTRRTGGPARATGFYARLLAILARRCRLRPDGAQTPREFAEAARQRLAGTAAGADLADIPATVVDRFYHVRFGREDLSEAECQQIDRLLTRLDRTLAGKPAPA